MFSEIITHDLARPLSVRAESRKFCGPYRWRPSKPGSGRGFYSSMLDPLVMDRAGSSLDLRLEWANDHLRGSRIADVRGYYADANGDSETLQPVIARLPHGRGFLAGWTMGAGMCGSLAPDVWPDEREAALAAHQIADHDAESSRDAEVTSDEEED